MPGHKITCPYCFASFDDTAVHFRMESVNNGDGVFRERSDMAYEAFWKEFGGTTETSSPSRDVEGGVLPWHRPVLDPTNPSQVVNFDLSASSAETQGDGIVVAAYDRYHKKTTRRVCPHCHNPLPGRYGRYPVKFVSLIGISGSGKTVYLSQLCRHLAESLGAYNISVMPTSSYPHDYMENNRVMAGELLPAPTAPEVFQQPLCFELTFMDKSRHQHQETFVFYDVAGENLQFKTGSAGLSEAAEKYAPFIRHSDAILMLIDPMQFSGKGDRQDAQTALEVIFSMFSKEELADIPFAVCISQADGRPRDASGNYDSYAPSFCEDIIKVEQLPGMRLGPSSANGGHIFNVDDYNVLRDKIQNYVETKGEAIPLATALRMNSDCYNFFMIESIGVPLEKNSSGYVVPSARPMPKRIVEPILWLLSKLPIDKDAHNLQPILSVEGFINEPGDWECPHCGKGHLRATLDYCPQCKLSRTDPPVWKCPSCGEDNPASAEWCIATRGCKTNRHGERKSLFLSFLGR